MFGKLYRRSFLEKWNIRFNTSLSNEDTGLNSVVRGCTDRIWYIPKDVYIWHFKANSITRIKQGMYGQDSGYKGYLDNMVWQILELQKRFVNKNYILGEIMGVMCTLYHFHVENMQRYPMNTEISMNWIRGYYKLVYQPYEQYITETMLMQTFANCAAGHNIAAKGIIPTITFNEFMKQVREVPMVIDPSHEVCGATPAGHIPEITSPDWPVEIHEYYDRVESVVMVDSDTNKSRYGGMKKMLGIELDETDYQADYNGSDETVKKQPEPIATLTPSDTIDPSSTHSTIPRFQMDYNQLYYERIPVNPCSEATTAIATSIPNNVGDAITTLYGNSDFGTSIRDIPNIPVGGE